MTDLVKLQFIAQQLEQLKTSSPLKHEDLDQWYEQAHRFTQDLATTAPEFVPTAFVWRYLSDADIRLKFPEYRAKQDEGITEIISELKSGIIPVEDEKFIPLPVAVAVVSIIAAALYFAWKWITA